MMDKNTDFPQFRKLINEKAYYHILDERNFEEIQIVGKKKLFHEVKADKYPEIIRIKDMLACNFGYILSDAEEFKKLKNEKE